MTEPSKLPEGIVMQILSRLPPKSLMRFKGSHKSWYTLIMNPMFTVKHLSNFSRKNHSSTCILLNNVRKTSNFGETEVVLSRYNLCNSNDGCDDHNFHTGVDELKIPLSMGLYSIGKGLVGVDISGHCDGIICLTDLRKNIVLCNPTIKEFKLLPESSIVLSSPARLPTAAVGFGYDFTSKDYKVVRIVSFGQEFSGYACLYPPKAEVYIMGTNSWKEIKTDNLVAGSTITWPFQAFSIRSYHMYYKGNFYWIAWEETKELGNLGLKKILSFDLGDETFNVISLPDGPHHDRGSNYDVQFSAWKESLAICIVNISDSAAIDITEKAFEIWVIDELDHGGVNGFWTKILTFKPVVHIQAPLAYERSDQFFLIGLNDGFRLFSYNVGTEEVEYLPFNYDPKGSSQVVFYVPSVVSTMASIRF